MLNSFWIELPMIYALTVGGLVSDYRRGGVPPDRRWLRALVAGLPVMVGLMIAWAIISGVVGPGRADVGPALSILDSLLTILFLLSASALAGSVLARRDPAMLTKEAPCCWTRPNKGRGSWTPKSSP